MTIPAPTIYSRDQWGARPWRNRAPYDVPATERRGVGVHYVGNALGLNVAQPRDQLIQAEIRLVRSAIQNPHLDARGWSDGAYSFVIGQSGVIYVLRGWVWDQFANGPGHNRDWYTACFLIGGTERPTPAALASLAWLVAEARRRGAGDSVVPHSTFQATSCPGDALRAHLPTLDNKPIDYNPEDPEMSLDFLKRGFNRFNEGDQPTVRFVQDALRAAGYKPGRSDGLRGPRTDAAVQAFKREVLGQTNPRPDLGQIAWSALIALTAGYNPKAPDGVPQDRYDAVVAKLAAIVEIATAE